MGTVRVRALPVAHKKFNGPVVLLGWRVYVGGRWYVLPEPLALKMTSVAVWKAAGSFVMDVTKDNDDNDVENIDPTVEQVTVASVDSTMEKSLPLPSDFELLELIHWYKVTPANVWQIMRLCGFYKKDLPTFGTEMNDAISEVGRMASGHTHHRTSGNHEIDRLDLVTCRLSGEIQMLIWAMVILSGYTYLTTVKLENRTKDSFWAALVHLRRCEINALSMACKLSRGSKKQHETFAYIMESIHSTDFAEVAYLLKRNPGLFSTTPRGCPGMSIDQRAQMAIHYLECAPIPADRTRTDWTKAKQLVFRCHVESSEPIDIYRACLRIGKIGVQSPVKHGPKLDGHPHAVHPMNDMLIPDPGDDGEYEAPPIPYAMIWDPRMSGFVKCNFVGMEYLVVQHMCDGEAPANIDLSVVVVFPTPELLARYRQVDTVREKVYYIGDIPEGPIDTMLVLCAETLTFPGLLMLMQRCPRVLYVVGDRGNCLDGPMALGRAFLEFLHAFSTMQKVGVTGCMARSVWSIENGSTYMGFSLLLPGLLDQVGNGSLVLGEPMVTNECPVMQLMELFTAGEMTERRFPKWLLHKNVRIYGLGYCRNYTWSPFTIEVGSQYIVTISDHTRLWLFNSQGIDLEEHSKHYGYNFRRGGEVPRKLRLHNKKDFVCSIEVKVGAAFIKLKVFESQITVLPMPADLAGPFVPKRQNLELYVDGTCHKKDLFAALCKATYTFKIVGSERILSDLAKVCELPH